MKRIPYAGAERRQIWPKELVTVAIDMRSKGFAHAEVAEHLERTAGFFVSPPDIAKVLAAHRKRGVAA